MIANNGRKPYGHQRRLTKRREHPNKNASPVFFLGKSGGGRRLSFLRQATSCRTSPEHTGIFTVRAYIHYQCSLAIGLGFRAGGAAASKNLMTAFVGSDSH